MTEDTTKLLDVIGKKILAELQENGRIPFTELGRRVGLSTPAVMDRVRRLEDAGIIVGYRADVDLSKMGYPLVAFIAVNVVGDFLPRMNKLARSIPEILECHRVTGATTFIMKVVAGSVEELEKTIDRLTPYVATTTSMVLSSVVTRRSIEPKRLHTQSSVRRT
jgi:Lrp/AsnC family transcriptional regulator, leucine-responsive regulatory protein